jgi:hypothetical protein
MAADVWKTYNKFKEYLGDGTIDLDNDAFKMGLYLSTSNAATLTLDEKGDLTNEHAAANGYTAGGEALTSVTWVESAGTVTFDCADVVWTASGGSIIARFAVIYDDTTAGAPPTDALVCYSLLDNAPADVTVTTGNTLTVQINASGVFTLSG